MVCRALNELDDVAVNERRVLIAMDRRTDLASAAREFPNLTLESFDGRRSAFVRRIVTTALRERIDLALIGHVNYAPLGLLLKRLRPNLRYGVVVHGVEAWSRLSRIKRRALRAADFLTSVSEFTKRQVVEVNGVNPERVFVLPNTLAWDDSRVAKSAWEKRLRILSVCRLDAREQYKGVDRVLETLPAVLARVPDIEYMVVGSGSDLDRHQRIAADLGVTDRVQFLGSVDEQTLRAAYESCDVFVLPSAGEGFGIVFLEAMHYRKPIIAANSGATLEVVRNGETGMLVDHGSVEQLAAAIIALGTNRSERERMGTFDHFKRRLHEIVLAELPKKSIDHAERHMARSASSLT